MSCEVFMSSGKHEGLSYPTHFLKSLVVSLGIIFLNTELKPYFLRDEIRLCIVHNK